MYKFTVFTIIFSAIVIVVVFNLVLTDFRIENKSRGVGGPEESVAVGDEKNKDDAKVKFILDAAPQKQAVDWRVNDAFWREQGLEDGGVISRDWRENIFSILAVTHSGVLGVKKFFVREGDLEGVELYEIQLADAESAQKQYENFIIAGQSSLLYSINSTDSYGEKSFYLNDELKPESVFLIILRGSVIYASAYSKEKHERMINIYNNLQ